MGRDTEAGVEIAVMVEVVVVDPPPPLRESNGEDLVVGRTGVDSEGDGSELAPIKRDRIDGEVGGKLKSSSISGRLAPGNDTCIQGSITSSVEEDEEEMEGVREGMDAAPGGTEVVDEADAAAAAADAVAEAEAAWRAFSLALCSGSTLPSVSNDDESTGAALVKAAEVFGSEEAAPPPMVSLSDAGSWPNEDFLDP